MYSQGLSLGRNPVVCRKLSSGNWSKREEIVSGYIWDEKSTTAGKFSSVKLKL